METVSPSSSSWIDQASWKKNLAPAANHFKPRLSRAGSLFAYDQTVEDGDIWLGYLDGRPPRRMTSSTVDETTPFFTPDNSYIIFGRRPNISMVSTSSGEASVLTKEGPESFPVDLSPDGRSLLYQQVGDASTDLWVLDLKTSQTREWLATSHDETRARFSPLGEMGTLYLD